MKVNVIDMSDILNSNPIAGGLFSDINAALENGCSMDEILVLEKAFDALVATQPDYEYLPTMVDMLAEARENIENAIEYEAIKAIIFADTEDEEFAEDMAWELVYEQ